MRLLRAHEFCSPLYPAPLPDQDMAWWVRASLSAVTVPGSAARFRTIADPDHHPLIVSIIIFQLSDPEPCLDGWRLHQEANWAFIISDFWEIAPRQGPGCKIIFNDVHLITREVFVSSHGACVTHVMSGLGTDNQINCRLDNCLINPHVLF